MFVVHIRPFPPSSPFCIPSIYNPASILGGCVRQLRLTLCLFYFHLVQMAPSMRTGSSAGQVAIFWDYGE